MSDVIKNEKVILHIDVDSFFVSCETSLRPELLNKEIAISGHSLNSIVTSLSYEAKSKGTKVPWKLWKVKKYCPNLIVIEPNIELYRNFSKKIYDFLFQTYSNIIQIGSIDEWYLDVSDIWKSFGSIKNLSINIRDKIWEKFSIPISIGVSYNKFLAKMATAINKPNGITFITYQNYKKMIWEMPITNYYGIGKQTYPQLIKLGINTIGDLAKTNIDEPSVKKIFLNKTKKYIDNANGIGSSKLDLANNILKSIANEITFVDGFSEETKEVYNHLNKLCQKISKRLLERNSCGSNISVSIKLDNSKKSKSLQVNKLINSKNDIYLYATKILKTLWNNEPVIGIGVAISKIENSFQNLTNKSLFEEEVNLNQIETIIENVNSKLNKKVVMSGKEFKEYKKGDQNKFL